MNQDVVYHPTLFAAKVCLFMSSKLINRKSYIMAVWLAPTRPHLLLTPSHFLVYTDPQMASGSVMYNELSHLPPTTLTQRLAELCPVSVG